MSLMRPRKGYACPGCHHIFRCKLMLAAHLLADDSNSITGITGYLARVLGEETAKDTVAKAMTLKGYKWS